MIQVFGRNLALGVAKLLLLSVLIFVILSGNTTYDTSLSFLGFFKAMFSGRLMSDPALTGMTPLLPALVYSVTILALALILSYGLGVPLGIVLGRYRMLWTQVLGHSLISITLAIPAFWVAYVVLYYSIADWGIYIGGEATQIEKIDTIYIGKCLLLAIPLSLSGIAFVARQVSQTLTNAFSPGSLRSARSLGITQRMIFDTVMTTVIWRPLLRSFPFLFSLFLSVLIVIETAFFVPGFGYAVYEAAEQSDLQRLAVLSLWISIALLAANMLVDIIVEFIDERHPSAPEMD
tara:strand:+ start:1699 stop:2571 length:873 start_codon:yes stop_codon:yes gene_type:complete